MYSNSGFMFSQAGRPRGLTNLGQSCYMNATVQSLIGTKFKDFCLSTVVTHLKGQVFNKFLEVVSSMGGDDGDPFNMVEFVTVVENLSPFKRGTQMDAQEFLTFFLDSVHNELMIGIDQGSGPLTDIDEHGLNEVVKSHWEKRTNTSPIAELFYTQIVTLMQCPTCRYSHGQFQDVNHSLSVPLPPPSPDPWGTSNPTITDCIAQFCKQQILKDGKCSKCEREGLQHRLLLGRLPPILIIHLKRFAHHFNGTMKKVHTDISVCAELNLTPFTLCGEQSSIYRVVGVTNHVGKFLHDGHYTTISQRGDRWYHFSDTKVSNTTARKLSSDTAYLVWYEKINSEGNLASETQNIISHFSQQNLIPVTTDHQSNQTEPVTDNLQTEQRQQDKEVDFFDTDGSFELFTQSESSVEFSEKITSDLGTEWEAPDLLQPVTFPTKVNNVAATDKRAAPHTCNTTLDLSLAAISRTPPSQTQGPSCDHPNLDLDIIDPQLTENDVPGAKLTEVELEHCLNDDMKRWLACRRLPTNGKRIALKTRILNHIRRKVSTLLYPGVDGGKWYELKRKRLMAEAQQTNARLVPIMPWGPSLFKAFPSAHIPNQYSSLKARAYLDLIPETRFSYENGVEAVESEPETQGLMDFSQPTQSDRKNIFVNGTLRRANVFIDSGRVLTMKDCLRNEHYFVKAEVQASYVNKIYNVTVTISKKSGSVCLAECCCKARALGRCCHIMAVLFLIGRHVESQGHEAVTCTGRLCYWLASGSSVNRQPGIVRERSKYYNEANYYRRGHFDPRPTANQVEEDESKVKYFQSLIADYPMKILWYYQLLDNPPLDECYPDEQMTLVIAEMCSYLLWNLNNIRQVSTTQPLHFPLTLKQSQSNIWFCERSVRIPASCAKRILGLSTENGRKNFMRKHMWGLDPFENDDMVRGRTLEPVARKVYTEDLKKVHPDYDVKESGIWVNPMCPQLSCSPDGLVIETNGVFKLLEIKCPAVLAEMDPKDFELLPKDQLGRFCLKRSEVTGLLELKATNAWYYQIQMSMDIMKVDKCDFVVFSIVNEEPKYLTVEVNYDESFWREKRERLIRIHRDWFVPEYFMLLNTVFNRPPFQLIYPYHHEDHEDNYFGDVCEGVKCLTLENESEFLQSHPGLTVGNASESLQSDDEDCLDVKLDNYFQVLLINEC